VLDRASTQKKRFKRGIISLHNSLHQHLCHNIFQPGELKTFFAMKVVNR